ncbi:MAG: hypothetical protein Q8941_07600 [Bacteroidota bacterium]|nr:hypothetical protein [Bacteroidota bacterium]
MKQKTFYILIIICSIGLFSSARPNGKECDREACSRYNHSSACAKPCLSKTVKEADMELPPMRLLLFDL